MGQERDMYEHLTTEARDIFGKAEKLAEDLQQGYVDTEHILLVIASRPSCPVAQLLVRHGVPRAKLEKKIRQLVKNQMSDSLVTGTLSSAPHLQNVVANAVTWARKLKEDRVDTKHLMLAVLHEEGSVARAALEELGVNLAQLQEDLLAWAM
jgi:ATP-dependent Clp protease ATP-binding subunit ClpC